MPSHPSLRPVGPEPRDPSAVVVILHGGQSEGHGNPHRFRLAYLRMLPFARGLVHAGRSRGLAVWMLNYRYRGWNGPDMDAKQDALWALDELTRRHSGAPVILVGHSMGGRAVLLAGGHPAVRAVCALAPWLEGGDPVEQLADRTVLIAHGDRDRTTEPDGSYAFAVRARGATDRVCRFEVHGDGHAMLRRARDWHSLVRRFTLGEAGIEPPDPEITTALRQPAPAGLRAALT